MKESISPQERRLLAAIILTGIFSNSHYTCTESYHVSTAIHLLDKLLTDLDKPYEMK
jgi:hypothetical protein